MTCFRNRVVSGYIPAAILLSAGLALAQDQPPAPPAGPQAQPQAQAPSDSGWRRFNGSADPQASAPAPPPEAAAKPDPSEPVDRSDDAAPEAPQSAQAAPPAVAPPASAPPMTLPAPALANRPPAYGVPAELTVKPGTYVSMRINQMLNSNRSLIGDTFSGTLAQPLVVDGVVVAQRGQTVYGRVALARKSSASQPSALALQLTGLSLVDGNQAPVQTQLVSWEGGKTPAGVEAGTVIGTTAMGAGIGGAIGWGTGAAVGAGAGAAAGAIAALVTHNRPTVVYPETLLTFRFDAPLTIDTTRATQAFRYVSPNDYNAPARLQTRVGAPRPPYGSYYGPYAYPPAYYPYPYAYWGPYFGVAVGRRPFGRW
ncbi:MAG TPA: hypothetical protein VMU19_04730 [Bryobacteraceae bacterium]|nr:hypothetical protein [Bryobacteraceae bacterium]